MAKGAGPYSMRASWRPSTRKVITTMNVTRRIAPVLFDLQFIAGTSFAQLDPDRITNPPGLQFFQDVAYNSEDDEYFLAYEGNGVPFGLRLTPNGTTILPQINPRAMTFACDMAPRPIVIMPLGFCPVSTT